MISSALIAGRENDATIAAIPISFSEEALAVLEGRS